MTILTLSIIVNLLVGLAVLLRNTASITGRFFALLAFSLSAWSLVSYLSIYLDSNQLLLIRLTMFFVILMNSAFFFLVYVFPRADFSFSRWLKAYVAFCIFCLVVAMSPWLFTDIVRNGDGAISPVPGPGMVFFVAHALISVIGAPGYLIYRYKRADSKTKSQLKFLVAGTGLMFSLLPLSNFVLPLVFNNANFIFLSPIYTVIFDLLIAYAIIRHKLFNVRLAVTRALTYFFMLGLIAVGYTILVFSVSSLLLGANQFHIQAQLVYTVLALVLAISFQSVKQYFDKLSSRFFFQDQYDPQLFLNKLNKVILTEIDVKALATQAATIIGESVKNEFTAFELRETDYSPRRLIGGGGYHERLSSSLEGIGYDRMSEQHPGVIVAEDIQDSLPKLYDRLTRANVAMIARLTLTSKADVQDIGYLVLGPKKSGNPYTRKDADFIGIIAGELAVAIQNSLQFEEIQKFNETLKTRIDDATGELRRSNKKLQELDAVKDEFISMASHQLRTPLTSIKGYLSMVLEGDTGDLNPMQRKFLEEAYNSSQRMVFLIGDFLNVSRLNTGKFIIEHNRTNLADMVAEEVEQLQPSAEARQLRIDYHKPAHFPLQNLDENKLRQVVMNFMDNAIFYSKPGGVIKVELTHTAKEITLKVKDQGIGVPAAQQHRLFEKFYRATNAQKARPDGSGIGLFLAKKVIVAHKGSVIFESREGKGSTFGFRLPIVSFNETGALSAVSAEADTKKLPV